MTHKVLIKYSEIALKGKNKYVFLNQLVTNIKHSAKRSDLNLQTLKKEKGHIICIFNDNPQENITKCLKNVFGIQFFSFIYELSKTIDSILFKGEVLMKELQENNPNTPQKIAFKTKRSDKQFPILSPDVNSKLGEIATKLGIKVDYKNAKDTIFTEINFKGAYMYSQKIKGAGGLPVRTSGKVLVLLSGGIDSPVATKQILKRGCNADFLHFHTYAKNEFVLDTKMKDIVEKLNNYQFTSKLHLIPYSYFELLTQGQVYSNYELVFFKHFIFKTADEVAKKMGYDAIVSGDSLCQVASQTIDNVKATSHNIDTLIFRPLLTSDKEEIINIAKEINTFNLSTQEYKDCCSLSSKNPLTQTNLRKFKKIVENSNLTEVITASLENMETFKID